MSEFIYAKALIANGQVRVDKINTKSAWIDRVLRPIILDSDAIVKLASSFPMPVLPINRSWLRWNFHLTIPCNRRDSRCRRHELFHRRAASRKRKRLAMVE
jgi:hypothetical protein